MSTTPLTADRGELTQFVDALFAYADRDTYVSLRCFRDDADGVALFEEWRTVRLTGNHDDLIDQAEDLATLAALADERICFAPPICTFRVSDKANEDNVTCGLVVTAELDSTPAAGRQRLEAILGPATVTMESGGFWINPETGELEPKLHLQWRLDNPTRTKPEHDLLKEANRLVTRLAGGDPSAVPLVHPLRWAGSWHRKSTPRLARVIDSDINREINLAVTLNKFREATAEKSNGHDPSPLKAFTDRPPAELLDIAAAIACIPNTDASWDEWNTMGLRLYAATGGSDAGLILFLDWSGRSAKFDAANTHNRWDHYKTSPPDRTNAGAIFNLAREHYSVFTRPSQTRRQAQFFAAAAAFDALPQPPAPDNGPLRDKSHSCSAPPSMPLPTARQNAGRLTF